MPALQTLNVSKSYGKFKALDKVSIEVNKQSVFGLLGPNGAGKTTLIRIINMISVMDEGQVLLDGKPIKQSDIQNIGYLPEERGLYKKMKVGEQAIYLARLKGLSKAEAVKRLSYWFEKFEIGSWWNKKVEELSKGMQQKIQFIATVLHQPKLLIFDEPFSGFDPINVNLLKDEILQLRDEGATIIFSTHNMESVEELCDHIALIDNSQTILSGEINEIKNRFKAHVFEVVYQRQAELSLPADHFEVLNTTNENKTFISQIRILNGNKPNDLLQQIMPHAEVVSFREMLPSMNEIFIRQVNNKEGRS
jgi:ABC-2 type transport system ATP-binding protein